MAESDLPVGLGLFRVDAGRLTLAQCAADGAAIETMIDAHSQYLLVAGAPPGEDGNRLNLALRWSPSALRPPEIFLPLIAR